MSTPLSRNPTKPLSDTGKRAVAGLQDVRSLISCAEMGRTSSRRHMHSEVQLEMYSIPCNEGAGEESY